MDRQLQIELATAVCREGSFRLLDSANSAASGRLDAADAVWSGQAYFGETHPWVWAIDIDDPTHPAVGLLRSHLDRLDIPTLECDSGRASGGLHIFANVDDSTLRDRIAEEVKRTHPDVTNKIIDWRRMGAIRPPGAPHRHGGRSWPVIDPVEALHVLQSWAPAEPQPELPRWVYAYMVGDWDWAAELGRQPKNRYDRSAVDVSIALAFRNAGWTFERYWEHRGPGGLYSSPKAVEKGDGAREYLWKQWSWAQQQPAPANQVRTGVDRLDELLDVIDADPDLTRVDRQVMAGVVELCRSFDKTSVAFSQRQLSEVSLAGVGSVNNSLRSGRLSRYLSAPVASTENSWNETPQYRLRVLEVLGQVSASSEQSIQVTPVDSKDCSQCVNPGRVHPVFVDRQGALGQTGYEALRGFDPVDARTPSEAFERVRDNVGRGTFDKRVSAFKEHGILVQDVDDPKRWRRSVDVDWDELAWQLGVADRADQLAERFDRDRRRYLDGLKQHGKIDAAGYVDRVAQLREKADQRRTRGSGGAQIIDFETGGILDPPPPPPSDRALSSLCRCCGYETWAHEIEPTTGLPWHPWCRMPAWIAARERRSGYPVPEELVARRTGEKCRSEHLVAWSTTEMSVEAVS